MSNNEFASALLDVQDAVSDAQSRLNSAYASISGAISALDKASGAPAVDQPNGKWNRFGFSTEADEEGAVEVKLVTEHLALLPEDARKKCFQKFYFEQAYRYAIFPSEIARMKAHKNLSSRRWTVFLFGGGDASRSDNAGLYEAKEEEIPNQVNNYDLPPEHRRLVRLNQVGVRFDAASMDWNPIKDANYIYNWWTGKARAELQALGYDPSKYNL